MTQESPSSLVYDALKIFDAALAAVDPKKLIESVVRRQGSLLTIGDQSLNLDKIETISIVGAGKAGQKMGLAIEEILGERYLKDKNVHGVIAIPPTSGGQRPSRIKLAATRASHENLPTKAGESCAKEIIRNLSSLGPNDLAITLLSGGGSALMAAPVDSISLDDKIQTTRLLATAGADIKELNTVRKHISEIKGGRLCEHFNGAHMFSLIISDVIGDPLEAIASGPTFPDPSTFMDAWTVLEKYNLTNKVPQSVQIYLKKGMEGNAPETLKNSLNHVTNLCIGNNQLAIDAAATAGKSLGYKVIDLGADISGEAIDVGQSMADLVLNTKTKAKQPTCFVGGGETTVSLVKDHGKGGRNQELVLAATHNLIKQVANQQVEDFCILSSSTDGEDGPTDAAGAWVDAHILATVEKKRLDTKKFLDRNDSYNFFAKVDSLIKTGITGTNVMDIQLVLVRN